MANFGIYQTITDRIISGLEKSNIPWFKPWVGGTNCAISHETGRTYSMLNQILLGNPSEYLTFNQRKKEDGKVKKGSFAKATLESIPVPNAQIGPPAGDYSCSTGIPHRWQPSKKQILRSVIDHITYHKTHRYFHNGP